MYHKSQTTITIIILVGVTITVLLAAFAGANGIKSVKAYTANREAIIGGLE